nr:hypothetical protein [Acidimicrobiia bacterium]
MSIAPQALERSVLERKERDELAAIATAMGVKASARASKSTLIDQILREAGIETGTPERPRRARSSKAASAPGDDGSTNGRSEAVIAPPEPVTDPLEQPDVDPGSDPSPRPVVAPVPEPPPAEPSPTEPGTAESRDIASSANDSSPAEATVPSGDPQNGPGPAAGGDGQVAQDQGGAT